MGEAGEARPGNSVRPSFSLWQHRANSCFVVYGADVTSSGQSHFFLSWVGQVSGPPGTAQSNPTIMAWWGEGSGQPGSRRPAGRGVPGPETSLMARLILIPERLQHGNGHLEVDGMCVLKGRLGLARGREDMLVTREMDLSLSRLLIC